MISVRHLEDDRMVIRMLGWDHLTAFALPSGCILSACLVMAGDSAFQDHSYAALLGSLTGLAVVVCLMAWFGWQTWIFDPNASQIVVKHGPFLKRTEPLHGLASARLEEKDDGDREQPAVLCQAFLVYTNANERPVSHQFIRHAHDMRQFVNAINAFVGAVPPALKSNERRL